MSASDFQPSSINPTLVYPEISNPAAQLTQPGRVQGASQQQKGPDRASEHSSTPDNLEAFLQEAAKHLQDYDPDTSELSVALDKDTHRIVVKLLNAKTKEVIRQIPPEEILRIARNMRQMKVGFLDEVA